MKGKPVGYAVLFSAFCLCALSSCVGSAVIHDIAAEYYNLGNAYYELGQYDKAIVYFEKALKINPGLLKVHFNLALALIRQQRAAEAVKIIEELLAKDPDNLELLQLLGYAYFNLGEYEKALQLFETILAKAPENLEAWYNKGVVLVKQELPGEAIICFQKILNLVESTSSTQKDGLFIKSLLMLGRIYLERQEWQTCVEIILRYLEIDPAGKDALLVLGEAYFGQERYLDALETYKKVIALDEKNTEIWFRLAVIYLTKTADSYNGFVALGRALLNGFKDTSRLKALLDNPTLVEPETVERILKEKGMIPKDYKRGTASKDAAKH